MRSVVLVVSMLALTGAAHASADLVKKYNCVACHAEARKMVGPAYKDVASKYGADGGAAEKLAKKIKAGGAGVWGPIPMPAHPQVSDADALTMAKYILTVK
jgi:cytochrome c